MGTYTTFVGTYTRGESEGIYRATMDTEAGTLRDVSLAAATENPSFLAIDPGGEHLYAANEVDDGALTAYRVDDGELAQLDEQVIGPAAPCHVSVDPADAYVFVAHYSGGAISVMSIRDDGRLGESTVIDHEGASVHPERQTEPHPHSVNVGPSGERLYVADLGTDEVVTYRIDRANDTLEREAVTPVHDGAGPRHLAFHEDANRAYLINELDSTVIAFEHDPDTGELTKLATVDTLEEPPAGDNYPADIHVHPDGEFLYGSNRVEDSIAVFALDDQPELLATEPCGGEWPRNFAIAPDGSHLFVANEHTDNVVPYAVDRDTGSLEPAGAETSIPAPVCLLPIDS